MPAKTRARRARRPAAGQATLDRFIKPRSFWELPLEEQLDLIQRVRDALIEWHFEKGQVLADLEEIMERSGVRDRKLLLETLEYLRSEGMVAKHTARRRDGTVTRWRLSNLYYHIFVRKPLQEMGLYMAPRPLTKETVIDTLREKLEKQKRAIQRPTPGSSQ